MEQSESRDRPALLGSRDGDQVDVFPVSPDDCLWAVADARIMANWVERGLIPDTSQRELFKRLNDALGHYRDVVERRDVRPSL